MPARPALVDREAEIAELHQLANRREPVLALLYGRRRVGKTYLLDHAWRGRRHFYFLAADTTAELNRRELLRELRASVGEGIDTDPANYPSWRTLFRLFATLATDEPLVVVLDEFQYLMGKDDDIVSQLVAVWDRELRGRPLMLVLCGSEVALMERLEAGDSPLYGRWSWAARLRPFDYLDAAAMVPDREPREAALVYGILGGTPRFLATMQPGESLASRVIESVLSPRGEVHLQLDRVIEQEKGIRDPAAYRALLAAIAVGKTQIEEIVQATGLGDRANAVRRVVLLERLELIGRERNFGAPAKAPWHYQIADLAVRFWYRFVQPNRSRLETGGLSGARAVWMRRVEPRLNDYMGKVFEHVCREAFVRRHEAWGLAGPVQWARWEGRDRNRRAIEIDLVARLDDGRLLTGEMKWSSRPVSAQVHAKLMRNLEDLAASGQGWAKDANSEATSAGHLYFSAAGFTDDFVQRAAGDQRIKLCSLDDLYRR
ncbi:MAG TPA: ATP-binding protein [Gemmatimonadaceae bacterium]|nr:ATP-binding protein [Gemmatimonadaceae bacterium]